MKKYRLNSDSELAKRVEKAMHYLEHNNLHFHFDSMGIVVLTDTATNIQYRIEDIEGNQGFEDIPFWSEYKITIEK